MESDNYLGEQVPLLTDPEIYRSVQAMCAPETISFPDAVHPELKQWTW